MTRQQVIPLLIRAGCSPTNERQTMFVCHIDNLVQFATYIVEAERRRCFDLCSKKLPHELEWFRKLIEEGKNAV